MKKGKYNDLLLDVVNASSNGDWVVLPDEKADRIRNGLKYEAKKTGLADPMGIHVEKHGDSLYVYYELSEINYYVRKKPEYSIEGAENYPYEPIIKICKELDRKEGVCFKLKFKDNTVKKGSKEYVVLERKDEYAKGRKRLRQIGFVAKVVDENEGIYEDMKWFIPIGDA